jgi:hypothetical protein
MSAGCKILAIADLRKAHSPYLQCFESGVSIPGFVLPSGWTSTCRSDLTLAFDAVVHRLPVDASRVRMLTLAGAIGFRQFEGVSFAPFVHDGLTGTRKRSVVRRREICAPGEETCTSENYPRHIRSIGANWTFNPSVGRPPQMAPETFCSSHPFQVASGRTNQSRVPFRPGSLRQCARQRATSARCRS